MLSITQVFAQNRTVTGTVTAKEDGLPLPGVTVKVKGTTNGTQTNGAGKFTLSVPNGAILEFRFIGYSPLTIVAKGDVVNASLSLVSSQLGEVVVTGALGVKTQSKELGYSTANIGNKLLTQAKVTNAATGLAGKVSGLQVNLTDNSVDPQVRIVLRGNRSLTGNNEALLVIDGVPIDDPNYLNSINPDDIESVNILKGATAASIYGSKASNGVLIVTTKHGTKGVPSITISNTTYAESLSFLPKLQTQYGGYGGEGGAYVNADGTVNPVPYENEGFGPAFDGRKILVAIAPKGFEADGVTPTGYDSLFTTYSAKKNNIKNFFNTGIQNQFDASYSSGSENGTFYLSFQDISHSGIVPQDFARRDNFKVAGSHSYGNFNADYSVTYDQNNVNQAGLSYNQSTGGVFSGRPLYFEVLNTSPYIPLEDFKDPTSEFGNPNSYFSAYSTNPYWTIDNSRDKTTDYNLLATLHLSYKITKWLTLEDRLGLTQRTSQLTDTRAGITFAPWAIADPQQAGNIPKSQKYLAPSDFDETFFEQRLNNDLFLNIANLKFGDFTLHGIVGLNSQQRYQRTIDLEGDALQFPGDYNIGSVLGTPGYGESYYKQREYSYYEDATLGFKDYLFLHLTNRDEWNSVLDPAHDHYEYPGANLSYVFTQSIGALKDSKVLSYGSVFGAITKVANINIGSSPYGTYSLINPFVPPAGYPYNAIGGYTTSGEYLNPNIQPEKTTEYEVGTELGFFDNRIDLKADFYNSKTRNQSLQGIISSATGYTSKLTNAGLVTNTGEEFDLNFIPIKSRNVTWQVGVNYSHYHNIVNELIPGIDELQLSSFNDAVGGGIYAIKGQPFPVIKTNDLNRDSKGRVIVDPITGMPSVNQTETVFGNTNPTQIIGVNSAITYKDFTFSFVLDYRGGYSIMNDIANYLAFTGIGANTTENGRQRFIYPNSVINTGTAASPVYTPNTGVAVNNGANSSNHGFYPDLYYASTPPGSLFITSAAFWKLREANLTYTLPKSVLAKAGFIKKASVSLIGRNLFELRPKSNIYTDPEFSEAGTGNAIGETSDNQTPPTRFYGANITLTF